MSEHKIVEKSWGSEIWFENNELYCGKLLTVLKDKWSSKGKFHFHKIKDETFYIIKGILHLQILDHTKRGTEVIKLYEGESYRVKPNVLHKFTSITGECKFIEVSTTHSDEDSFRVV